MRALEIEIILYDYKWPVGENFKLEGYQLYYRKGARGMKSDVSREGKL